METLRCGIDSSHRFVIFLRDEKTRTVVANTYNGLETLSVEIGGAVYLSTSAQWCVVEADVTTGRITGADVNVAGGAAGTVLLTIDDADLATLGVGTFGLSVYITEGGEPYEAYRATLKVECR